MRFTLSLFMVFSSVFLAQTLHACESCAIAYLGKKEQKDLNQKHRVRAKVMYEAQDWKELPAMPLHNLHHDGKHVHDKQNEEIIHTIIAVDVTNRLTINTDIPYVTKHYIEVDSHPRVGQNQKSQGLGDMTLTGDYRFFQDETKSLGVIAGLKLPTGNTKEYNSFGGLMEPELQPGTGSLDYIGGISGSLHPNNMDFSASAIYIYRTEGKQNYRAGDLLSITLHGGKTFILREQLTLTLGAILNNQLEKKANNEGGFIKDSGGFTMLAGPQLSLGFQQVDIELAYLFPAVQNLGGVHQELDEGMWTTSIGVRF